MSNTKKIKVKKKKEEEKVDNLTLMVRESLGSMGRSVNPQQEKMLVDIYKKFIVGGVSNIIDFFLFMIIILISHWNPLLVNAIVLVVVLIYGIWMSFRYLFPKDKYQKPFIQYLFLMLVAFLLTEGILWELCVVHSWNSILVKLLTVILMIFIKWGLQIPFMKKKKHLK